ncbi:LamG-like jellyroll fold domain-containing protein [Paenibacillus harenae]|uniref:LamG-like jellyroll fold domain-containing protein n=1 Tax=Paenibacillus harenae TaxID=306543 RepID=UPI0003FAC135|nr:LamG-like jellyroll fold domain-containing protein [Paenibacillus harenae]
MLESYPESGRALGKKAMAALESVPKPVSVATTTGKPWSTTKQIAATTLDGKEEVTLTAPMYDGYEILLWGSSTMDSQGASTDNLGWKGLLNGYYGPSGLTFRSRGVGGNTSAQALARFNFDIAPSKAQFVVIGVTIGNEDFHNAADDGARQVKYRTIKENILKMANKVRDHGKVPIVVTQFPTQRYDAIHLQYAKALNNELEAVGLYVFDFMNCVLNTDSATGQPITAAVFDISHINDVGQKAFAKSIPYVWDKLRFHPKGFLESKKGYIHTGNLATDIPLTFFLAKGAAIESFTVFSRFRLTEAMTGAVSLISLGTNGAERVFVNPDGSLSLLRTGVGSSTSIAAAGAIALNTWYSLAITYNVINGKLDVFLDAVNIYSGTDTGLTAFGTLNIGGRPAATAFLKNANIKDVIVYRVKKQAEQIKQLHDGIVSQSALELFAPLNDKVTSGGTNLLNLAATPNNLRIAPAVSTITAVTVGPGI